MKLEPAASRVTRLEPYRAPVPWARRRFHSHILFSFVEWIVSFGNCLRDESDGQTIINFGRDDVNMVAAACGLPVVYWSSRWLRDILNCRFGTLTDRPYLRCCALVLWVMRWYWGRSSPFLGIPREWHNVRLVPVLYHGSWPSSAFLARILGVHSLLFLYSTHFYFSLSSQLHCKSSKKRSLVSGPRRRSVGSMCAFSVGYPMSVLRFF